MPLKCQLKCQILEEAHIRRKPIEEIVLFIFLYPIDGSAGFIEMMGAAMGSEISAVNFGIYEWKHVGSAERSKIASGLVESMKLLAHCK